MGCSPRTHIVLGTLEVAHVNSCGEKPMPSNDGISGPHLTCRGHDVRERNRYRGLEGFIAFLVPRADHGRH